jgi:hypothetical protein
MFINPEGNVVLGVFIKALMPLRPVSDSNFQRNPLVNDFFSIQTPQKCDVPSIVDIHSPTFTSTCKGKRWWVNETRRQWRVS